jgi:hypothetical protein
VGLHLLEDKASGAVGALEKALRDEEDEVKIMAAWTLVKVGRREAGLKCLRGLLNNGTTCKRKLLNVLDWMGDDAVPLVREYLKAHPKEAKNILAKIAQDHGIEVGK